MNEVIAELLAEKIALESRVEKIKKAITALQETCEHITPQGREAFTWKGNHGPYNLYTCTICNTEKSI